MRKKWGDDKLDQVAECIEASTFSTSKSDYYRILGRKILFDFVSDTSWVYTLNLAFRNGKK